MKTYTLNSDFYFLARLKYEHGILHCFSTEYYFSSMSMRNF